MGATAQRAFQPLAAEPCIRVNTMTRKLSARCILIMTLFLLPGFMSAATPPRNLTFGVYTGWSVGVSEKRGGGGWHEDFAIDLSLGAYVQYNFSPKFGVQANGNYQHGRMDWYLLTYTPNYELTYDEGTERFQFVTLNVNGVYNESRWRASVFYVLAGGGITVGDWYEFSGVYFNLTVGAGVKISLSSSHPELALNFGMALVHLMDNNGYEDLSTDYFRFQVGMEF